MFRDVRIYFLPTYSYKGHVCLIVNVASKCGLTATNYKQLNELYDEYADSKGKIYKLYPFYFPKRLLKDRAFRFTNLGVSL